MYCYMQRKVLYAEGDENSSETGGTVTAARAFFDAGLLWLIFTKKGYVPDGCICN